MATDRSERTHDRHLSTFMVRLPEVYRIQLRTLSIQTQRSVTDEVRLAVESHLMQAQLWPPTSNAESPPSDPSS